MSDTLSTGIYGSAEGPPPSLREATTQDAAAIASLIASEEELRQILPDAKFPLGASDVEGWIHDSGQAFVLQARGGVVGYADLMPDPIDRGTFWIGHVLVDSNLREKGLGRKMVRTISSLAFQEKNCRRLKLTVFSDNQGALGCYRHCGFRIRARRKVPGGTLVEMALEAPARRRTMGRFLSLLWGAVWATTGFLVLPIWQQEVESPISTPIVPMSLAGLSMIFSILLWRALPHARSSTSARLLRNTLFAFGALLPPQMIVYLSLPGLNHPLQGGAYFLKSGTQPALLALIAGGSLFILEWLWMKKSLAWPGGKRAPEDGACE